MPSNKLSADKIPHVLPLCYPMIHLSVTLPLLDQYAKWSLKTSVTNGNGFQY